MTRRRRLGPEPTLLAWQVTACPRTLAAWCPHCLCWHRHGWPRGREAGHRVAHCHVPGAPDGYDLEVLGRLTPAVLARVRADYRAELAHRAAILRARGASWVGRLAWPRPMRPRRPRGRR